MVIQTDEILYKLGKMIASQNEKKNQESDRMQTSWNDLEFVVRTMGLALVFGGILIALFTARMIVKPVQQLKKLLLLLGKGIIPKQKMKDRNDEIGEMSAALNDLMDGFKRTVGFAREVGSGDFKSEYHPLSEDDTLGHSLLGMRKDLFELTSNLEMKVKERTEEVVRQKEVIEEKNKDITASIRYAKRIQEAILPDMSYVNRILKDNFILYKPKDIVSGDFYWIENKGGKALFAAVDCTGHGVPGAFMSIIGTDLLKQTVGEHKKIKPADILNELNRLAAQTIKQTFEESVVKDGMDVALCSIDYNAMELEYAGAYNPAFIVRKVKDDSGEVQDAITENGNDDDIVLKEVANGYQLIAIKADKFPIGVFIGEEVKNFKNHKFKLKKDDVIYTFSDGFIDQFGGKKGKKFMSKRFRQVLLEIQHLSMSGQRDYLDKTIADWIFHTDYVGDMNEQEQIDDILVIGVRI